MATASGTSLTIPDVLECLICSKVVKAPKVRSCIHTFCFQCLITYCAANNNSQNGFACPVCRKLFSMSSGGMEDLSDNVFIQLNLIAKNSVETKPFHKPPVCELCLTFENTILSTCYCTDCEQRMCDRCKISHNKAKISQSHRVMRHINVLNSTETSNVALNYCDRHPSELERLYCYDCKIVMCHLCVNVHSKHELTDVEKSTEKFRLQLENIVKEVLNDYANKKLKEIFLLKKEHAIIFERIFATERELFKWFGQLNYVEFHYRQVRAEIIQFLERILKCMRRSNEEVVKLYTAAENLKRDCVEIMKNGTASEISRIAHKLLSRAEELVTIRYELIYWAFHLKLKHHFPKKSSGNVFKVLLFKELPAANPRKRYKQKLDLRRLLLKPKFVGNHLVKRPTRNKKSVKPKLLTHVIETIEAINGLTVLFSHVFIVRGKSQIDVYKPDNFIKKVCELSILGSSSLDGIISCANYNCLYAIDRSQTSVYRYDLASGNVTVWIVDRMYYELSLTKSFHILFMIMEDDNKFILRYDTHGALLQTIQMDMSISQIHHCVQLSPGNYVVCHGGEKHQICIVNQDGIVQKFYEPPQDLDLKVRSLVNVCVDAQNNLLVADENNQELLLLSSSLSYIGYIDFPEHETLIPDRLHLDEFNHRLYIQDFCNPQLIAVDFVKFE